MILLGILQDSTQVIVDAATQTEGLIATNTAKQWLAIIIDAIIGLPMLAGILYIIYVVGKMVKTGDLSFSQLSTSHVIVGIEALIVITSLGEIVVLSLIALERGVMLSASLLRYGSPGVLEILFSYILVKITYKAVSDGVVDLREWGYILFSFLLSTTFTLLILLFYLESVGTFSWFSDNHYEIVTKKEEFGAYWTILCTIPLNIIVVILLYFNKVETEGSKPSSSKDKSKDKSNNSQHRLNQKAKDLVEKGRRVYNSTKNKTAEADIDAGKSALILLTMQYILYRSGVDAAKFKGDKDKLKTEIESLKDKDASNVESLKKEYGRLIEKSGN